MEEAKELIGENRFEALAKNTEASLHVFADEFDVELNDEAVDDVLEFICEFIVESDAPGEFAEDLISEMSEPTSSAAMANVSMAIGGTADENESLAEIREAIFEAKYSEV